jgi:hypothetical protein
MKQYFAHFLSGFLAIWMMLWLLGLSAGIASILPILAFVGGLVLFVVASTLSLFYAKVGAIIAIIGNSLILPWYIGIASANLGFLPIILIVVAILSLVTAVESLRKKTEIAVKNPRMEKIKLIIAPVPILIALLWALWFFGVIR